MRQLFPEKIIICQGISLFLPAYLVATVGRVDIYMKYCASHKVTQAEVLLM